MSLHPISDGAGFQSYTPVWTTDGTPPSLGNGTLLGRYVQIGKLVIVRVIFIAGSTTTFGTSFWKMSLPVPSAAALGGGSGEYGMVGTCWDISATTQFLGAWRADTYVFGGHNVTTGAMLPVTSTAPFTWANTDRLEIGRIYEAA